MKKHIAQKAIEGDSKVVDELHKLEEIEYGTKELIHGVLIGIIIGFFLALVLMG